MRQREMEGHALIYPHCIYTERNLISFLQLPGVNARDVGNCVRFPPTDGKCDGLKGNRCLAETSETFCNEELI